MVYVVSYISGIRQTWALHKDCVSAEDIADFLYFKYGCKEDMCLWYGRKCVSSDDVFPKNAHLVATLRLRGGKGGFGSMLRAIGAQIEKTTNREACRDLSGRRLRDINEEKRLKEFLAKKVEKEKETLALKKKKLEQLKEGPKHYFEDKSYFEQREKTENDIYESLDKAFATASESGSSSGVKRHSQEETEAVKRKKKRMLNDLDISSESETEDSDAGDEAKIGTSEINTDKTVGIST